VFKETIMPEETNKPAARLYRRYFTLAERRDLDAHDAPGLLSEINLMRVTLARNIADAAPPPQDLLYHRLALAYRAEAAALIASLLRTHLAVADPLGDLWAAIEEGLRLYREEEGL
jgi:hypothetical protein